ncbi:hypothetical protein K525DRAFT_185508 [Schizophyllum commune Loenen D]|nr:hypothetical protein K525DRAFT_185508 [Schizophyllum commune Loenen D]
MPAPSFTEFLTLDLLLVITEYLLPEDIVSLRKTCRSFLWLTQSRSIWMTAVRMMCARNLVFRANFDVENMSLEELEHAATAPSRFLRLLQKHASTSQSEVTIKPLAKRTLLMRLPETVTSSSPLAEHDGFTVICLVPGGRFLAATSERHFHVWDLGRSGYERMKPLPIYCRGLRELAGTQRSDAEPSFALFSVCESRQAGKFVAVLTSSSPRSHGALVLELHFSVVTSDLIGVQTVGIIHLNWKSDTVIMDVSEDLMILDENDPDTAVTLIWNYRENALGSLPALDDPPNIAKVLPSGNSVALAYDGRLHVYRIPPLVSVDGPLSSCADLPSAADYIPIIVLTTDEEDGVWVVRDGWYNRRDAPLSVDRLTSRYRSHLAVAEITTPQSPTMPDQIPYTLARFPTLPWLKLIDESMSVAPSEGRNVLAFTDDHSQGVMCAAYVVSPAEPSTPSNLLYLTREDNVTIADWDFCPASGRVCLVPFQDGRCTEIVVLDFLVPDRGL